MSYRWFSITVTCTALVFAGACAPVGESLPQLPQTASIDESYVLGPGDRLQIVLYGVNEASGRASNANDTPMQYVVSETGALDVPLIGTTTAIGLTVEQLKQKITQKLADGYLTDPKIGVDILSYRPFYIVGEVNHPGSYPCSTRSRILSAVALAGGYTYRANEDFAIIERRIGDKIVTGRADPDSPILPDDVIRITQRYY